MRFDAAALEQALKFMLGADNVGALSWGTKTHRLSDTETVKSRVRRGGVVTAAPLTAESPPHRARSSGQISMTRPLLGAKKVGARILASCASTQRQLEEVCSPL